MFCADPRRMRADAAALAPSVSAACRRLALLVLIASASGLAQPAWAGEPASMEADWPATPDLSRRRVRFFDFEEAKLGNFEDLPINWYAVGRPPATNDKAFPTYPLHAELIAKPGFPRHAEVHFDRPQSQPGPHQLYLRGNGGNAGAFLEVGAVPAVPGSDYLVTARLRTRGLEHAGGRLWAYLLDASGRRLPQQQGILQNIDTQDRWREVSVRIPGAAPQAAWIGLQVDLLQPATSPDAEAHRVAYRDIGAEMWVDDVAIWQVPRVGLTTQSEVNIIRMPERPTLDVEVRDLIGESMSTTITVHDSSGGEVARHAQRVNGDEPMTWKWSPPLPRAGWYRAELTVREGARDTGPPIARAACELLWVATDRPIAADRSRFALGLGESMGQAAEMLERLDLHAAVIPAWRRDLTPDTLDARLDELSRAIDPMLNRGDSITLTFAPMPRLLDVELQKQGPTREWAFSGDLAPARPYMAPFLRRFGQRVTRWQAGSATAAAAAFSTTLDADLAQLQSELRSHAPSPRPVIPWRSSVERHANLPLEAQLAIELDPGVQPRHLPQQLEPFLAPPAATVHLHLRTAGPEVARHSALRDLTLRMIEAWRTEPASMVLDKPWRFDEHTPRPQPDATLGVFASVARRLAGRRVVGEMNSVAGVRAIVFDGPDGGMLALWRETASSRDSEFTLHLGPRPERVDVFGNREPIPETQGEHTLRAQAMPEFIEGVDAKLALFRARFALDRPFIESTQSMHTRQLVLRNPWPTTLTGALTIIEPVKWQIEPRVHALAIPPGGEQRLPLKLLIPASEMAGGKRLTARAAVDSLDPQRVSLATPIEIGLPSVRMDADLELSASRSGPGHDAVITQIVRNVGVEPLSLYAFAFVPGQPRQERVISRLLPGQSTVRRFRFPGLSGDPLSIEPRVGLREPNGPAILNRQLRVEEE